MRSLLFNYENQARDIILINCYEVYLKDIASLFFGHCQSWFINWHGLLPLIFLGSHFLPNPHFVPPVAPVMWPRRWTRLQAREMNTQPQYHLRVLLSFPLNKNIWFFFRSLVNFSDPWICLGFPKLLWNPDWVPAMWEVLMQSEMFEGLMPVPCLSCHQPRPSQGSEVRVTS